jgi:hypothetical protein
MTFEEFLSGCSDDELDRIIQMLREMLVEEAPF